MPGHPANVKEIKRILLEKNLAPLKSLGQNFLIDQNILTKIANAGDISSSDLVLEIGPGLGALTEHLLDRAGKVIAVEYDRGLFEILQELFSSRPHLNLINADFLQVDLERIIRLKNESVTNFKVIANLPYYITSPLIFKLVESGIRWERMVFLVQKEVARRICAKPGSKEYGTLTVMLNYYGRIEQVGIVSRNVFYPAPQVDSAIIRITPDWSHFDSDIYINLQQVVQAAFGRRRKTILNAFDPIVHWFGGKDGLAEVLQRNGIDPERRGETLGVAEFIALAEELRLRKHRGCADDFCQPD